MTARPALTCSPIPSKLQRSWSLDHLVALMTSRKPDLGQLTHGTWAPTRTGAACMWPSRQASSACPTLEMIRKCLQHWVEAYILLSCCSRTFPESSLSFLLLSHMGMDLRHGLLTMVRMLTLVKTVTGCLLYCQESGGQAQQAGHSPGSVWLLQPWRDGCSHGTQWIR